MGKIIFGNATELCASAAKGWVVGHFAEGEAHSEHVEIKLWRYDTLPDYPKKAFSGTEFIVIYGGALRIEGFVNEARFTYLIEGASHDFIMLPPGTEKQVFLIRAPAYGVCVRWPSAPGLNNVL